MDCSELMGSKASDVAVVGSRYPSSELLLYSAISHPDISTSTMTPQMYITQRVTRKTRASRSSLYFDTDLITPRYSHSLEIRKQIRLATPNKTYLLMAPQTQKQWTVQGIAKDFSNLTLNKEAAIPELGDHDVLVKCENDLSLVQHVASLTLRVALAFDQFTEHL
jgi:hypothetical protein